MDIGTDISHANIADENLNQRRFNSEQSALSSNSGITIVIN